MSGILSKFRLVTLATVNDLLSKAIDLNSPSAVRQNVRDLEAAQDRMNAEAINAGANVRTLKREKQELQIRITGQEKQIQSLVNGGHQDLARPKAQDLVQMRNHFAEYDAQIAAAEKASHDIDVAVASVEAKHSAMMNQLNNLENLASDTKAKKATASALAAAGRLASTGADLSVDDITTRMKKENDVANEAFSRATADATLAEDPETTAAVDDVLNEFTPKEKSVASGI